jgi:type I restriction enzyme M protein
MTTYVSLNEAASYLGVSKATLRNWDKAGKLRAIRDPINQYRVYALTDLQQIQARLPLGDEAEATPQRTLTPTLDVRATRTLISRLHNILRNSDSHSNIIERFDELTKLLFLKLYCEDHSPELLSRKPSEDDPAYALRVRQAYTAAARDNPQIVPSAFSTLNASDQAVCECATALAQVSFRDVDFDVKGLAYEEVIKNTFDKTDNQQFFTPPTIVSFIVEMMRPELSGEICDPAAGTGGFLVEVLKSGVAHNSLTALEIDERLAWVAGINLFTHGAGKASAVWLPDGGTLGRGAEPFFGSFDAIITNPPFGSDFTDTGLLPAYTLGGDRTSRRRGILFLERCHQLLKPGGVMGFIIDEGVLNGASTEDVRRFMTENFHIEAIVSLPESAFMPYATVNASILFLRKRGAAQDQPDQTFFAKAENIGRKGNGDDDVIYDENGTARLNSDLPEIAELYRAFRSNRGISPSESAYVADIDANFREEQNGQRLDFRYHHPSRRISREQLSRARGRLLMLAEICQERNQTLVPSSELADQTILYTGLAHIEANSGVAHQVPTPANSLKSAVRRYEPGDIIFAKMRPNLRKVALMQTAEGGYVSPECVVLTVREGNDGLPIIDPLLLSVLLRSDLVYGQIMHLIAGIGRPRLSTGDLRRVLIPSVDHAAQERWRAKYLAEINAASHLREKAAALLQDAAAMERGAVENVAKEFI